MPLKSYDFIRYSWKFSDGVDSMRVILSIIFWKSNWSSAYKVSSIDHFPQAFYFPEKVSSSARMFAPILGARSIEFAEVGKWQHSTTNDFSRVSERVLAFTLSKLTKIATDKLWASQKVTHLESITFKSKILYFLGTWFHSSELNAVQVGELDTPCSVMWGLK